MVYLDLAELATVFRGRWLWSTSRKTLAQFRRDDYLGDPEVPLDDAVRNVVEAEFGRRPTGPIRMLTQLRYFGICFNPITLYYCFDAAGQHLDAIVAEVSNTPWNERHVYVLGGSLDENGSRYRTPKRFHVSPFMQSTVEYRWGVGCPGTSIDVQISALASGKRVFEANLCLERRPITGVTLATTLARFPAASVGVIVSIYWQALRLWLMGLPVYRHPSSDSM